MKTVFTDVSTIAHYWANKTQEEAKNPARNFYFYGDSIYSYGSHFCIAKHVETKQGKFTFFTTRSYSNTTAKQISVVSMAARHLDLIYCAHPEDVSKGHSYHKRNINAFISEIEAQAHILQNARKPEIYLTEIDRIKARFTKYVDVLGVKLSPAEKTVLETDWKEGYRDYLTNKQAEIDKAEKKRQRQRAKELKEIILKFRNFEAHRLYFNNGADILRYDADKKRIETSQGVEVPEKIAHDFYKLLVKIKNAGGCTEETCNAKLMDAYSLNEVTEKHVKIGCHTIEWKEINTLATQLNW
jgi:hypothetical protein